MPALVWPDGSSVRPTVTSFYGPRTHPVTGRPATFHHGIDLVGFERVVAPCDGIISLARYNGGAGNEGRIRRPNGDSIRLMHHAWLAVREGQRVRQGEFIGLMGTTGNSTGVHSHFEIRDPAWNSLEPIAYMAAANAEDQGASAPNANKSEEDDMHESKSLTLKQGLDGKPGQAWPIQLQKGMHSFAETGAGQSEEGTIVLDLVFTGPAEHEAASVYAIYEEKQADGAWKQITARDKVILHGRDQYVDIYSFGGAKPVRGRIMVDNLRNGIQLAKVSYRKRYTRG